ncbi:peroxiredoxin-like family protein [Sphingomonas sp.]|uniref:peroxiredoxin-like family protein n=1 Tax=Sphingomonas sp. TaxID=28214 RepID=UPI0035A894A0
MSHSEVNAIEEAFREAKLLNASLGVRLQHVSDHIRRLKPDMSDAVDTFVARLLAAGVGDSAPNVGETMPDFMLPDQDGQFVNLETLREKAPVVLVFHRGHWCPYCRLAMAGFAEIQYSINPFKLVGISPERQQYSRIIRSESEADFPFLTDVGSGYTLSLNLAIWVDDAMAAMIGHSGADIPNYAGTNGWFLPIPAVFVIGQDGRVIARHIDADYRRRMELEDVIAVLDSIRSDVSNQS